MAFALFASGAEAGVGESGGSALSSFGRLSPAQKVQYGGDCWYDNGWNGPGWYQCGNEWNNGLGWVGPFGSNGFVGAAIRRHHHHGVGVGHSQAPNNLYRGVQPSQGLGAGAVPPSAGLRAAAPAFGAGPGFRRFGAGGVHASPGVQIGGAPLSPGIAGAGFQGLTGGSRFHGGGIGIPRIGAPASPGFAAAGGLQGLGGATGVHIGAPVSPGFAGAGALHGLGGATGIHIGAPASPGFAAGGGFHGIGGVGAPHIGAPVSPGLAGGGFHGVGAGGVFLGGGAGLGQGGIGHR
jgi:hypothetical protein